MASRTYERTEYVNLKVSKNYYTKCEETEERSSLVIISIPVAEFFSSDFLCQFRVRNELRKKRNSKQKWDIHQELEYVVGHVPGVGADSPGARVGEHDRGVGGGEGVPHGVGRDVRQVHQHPQAVHLADYLQAERGEAAAARGGLAAVHQGGVGPARNRIGKKMF